MAAITLSWPRLMWPAWAARQAAPWVRKMSATSRAGWGMGLPSGRRIRQRQMIERAHHGADELGGHPGVAGGGVELGMAEQHLDDADVDILLEQVGGEAVAQSVQAHGLVDFGQAGGGMTGAVELTRGERADPVLTGKEPALRSGRLPPGAQEFEQLR